MLSKKTKNGKSFTMTFEDDIKLIDVNKLRVTMKTEMTSEPNACM